MPARRLPHDYEESGMCHFESCREEQEKAPV
jgi:hypothetical protein